MKLDFEGHQMMSRKEFSNILQDKKPVRFSYEVLGKAHLHSLSVILSMAYTQTR